MAKNRNTIEKFYTAFARLDADAMVDCYHDDIVFEDPAFGILKGERAKQMWHMLIARSNGNLDIEYVNIETNKDKGSANWVATYKYSTTGRLVVNRISAQFKFKDGKIIHHKDDFDLWKWTKQALGLFGYLLGWSSFMKAKIQNQTNKLLNKYMTTKFKNEN